MSRQTPQQHEARILTLIAERGLRLERRANSVRIVGPGVSLTAASLEFVDARDLVPAKGDARMHGSI